jgi:hypothetical protein
MNNISRLDNIGIVQELTTDQAAALRPAMINKDCDVVRNPNSRKKRKVLLMIKINYYRD